MPRFGFGAMRLTGQPGNFGPHRDPAAGLALLRRAYDLGIRFIDTARAYGPGDKRWFTAALRIVDRPMAGRELKTGGRWPRARAGAAR